MKDSHIGLVVAVAAAALAFAFMHGTRPPPPIPTIADVAPVKHPSSVQGRPIERTPQLAVAFRLETELTRGMYLGDRWVSPPTYYFAQPGKRFVVQAKPQQIDKRGERLDLAGEWTTSDPDKVSVIQRKHGEVTIVVEQPGDATVKVTTGNGSKLLKIHATQVADAMQVAIDQ